MRTLTVFGLLLCASTVIAQQHPVTVEDFKMAGYENSYHNLKHDVPVDDVPGIALMTGLSVLVSDLTISGESCSVAVTCFADCVLVNSITHTTELKQARLSGSIRGSAKFWPEFQKTLNEAFGTVVTSFSFPDGAKQYIDKVVNIDAVPTERNTIALRLQNLTDMPLTIDWDHVSYVDTSKRAHGVIHSGVPFMAKDQPQAPTVVPPDSMIEDTLIPKDFLSRTSNEWEQQPLFPMNGALLVAMDGKTIGLFMPLKLDDGTTHNVNVKLIMHVTVHDMLARVPE